MTHRNRWLSLLLALAACGRAPSPDIEPLPEGGEQAAPLPSAADIRSPAELRSATTVPSIAEMSLRDKAAQLVMPWIDGAYWADDNEAMEAALRLVTEHHVGGFVIGIGTSPYDVAAKLNRLQRASPLPLLMAADLESGPSMRIRGGTVFPGNMALGATGREEDAYDVGRVIAIEGRAVGFHIAFSPVLDVNNNPSNPIINTRSFGEDPVRVARLGAAFIRGLHDHGMLATAKHFPGHGDTGTDSHVALPVIPAARSRLDSLELVPFRAAVEAGVDAVMSAHIALPNIIGGQLPATLSPLVLDTLLRQQMGFRGLVITDALNMGAIASRYGVNQAAVMALQAGADVLLMPTDPAAAIDAVVQAVLSGAVREARLDSSVRRVLDAKRRVGLFQRRTVSLEAIPRLVGIRGHQELALDITRRALVLAMDSLGLVPLSGDRRRVTVVAYGDEGNTTIGVPFAATLRAAGVQVRFHRLYPASGPASFDSVRVSAALGGSVIFAVSARPVAWQPSAVSMPAAAAALMDSLARSPTPVLTIAFGSPYVLGQVPNTNAYLIAWAEGEMAQRAAAEAVLGRAGVDGRLPVALPPRLPVGAGLTRAPVNGVR